MNGPSVEGLIRDLSELPQELEIIRVNGKKYSPKRMIEMIKNGEKDGVDYTNYLFI